MNQIQNYDSLPNADDPDSGAPEQRRTTVTGLFRDIGGFVLAGPRTSTLVESATQTQREYLSQSIQQRLGIDVTTYSILNVHRIGIDVPGQVVFNRLMTWGGESPYWPNHLARITRVDEGLENINIRLFGWRRCMGFDVTPLFRLKAVRIQAQPGATEHDSARYLLFTCEGGYPIGHFVMYVRSSIPAMGELGSTQLFLAVGFNFYGRRRMSRTGPGRIVTAFWEMLHNRVTSHVLSRLKTLCEDGFREVVEGR